MYNIKKMFLSVLIGMVFALSFLYYQLINWAQETFADLSLDQIIFHLKVPLDGADSTYVSHVMKTILLPTVALFVFYLTLFYVFSKMKHVYFLKIISGIGRKQPKAYHFPLSSVIVLRNMALGFSFFMLVLASYQANKYYDVYGYFRNVMEESTYIEDHYVHPRNRLTFPEQKRNLIYIYLESMENTFASFEEGGRFQDNYIAELGDLAKEYVSFSHRDGLGGFHQVYGTGWTIAAMFSQSTGLPLMVPIQGNTMSQFDEFFPGVTSIGDILEEQGYTNNLLIGSDATFGGRRNFYEQHGNYRIYDYVEAQESGRIPENYFVWWGHEDQILFDSAKTLLMSLAEGEEPFNLTMLTVDTHHEDGYVCDLCEDTYLDQYANVIACSSRQVYDFISWIKGQSFYENTSIIIVGDHFTMDKDFLEDTSSDIPRTIYNVFINSGFANDEVNLKHRTFNAFDLFPTTLASLGVEIEGNRLGLGTNVFSDENTLMEEQGKKAISELSKSTRYYNSRFLYYDSKWRSE